MIKRDEIIKIGQFNKPHALQGEISFTLINDIFDNSETPYIVCNIDGIYVPFFIEEYRFKTATTGFMKLIDIESSDDAKMFTNIDIYYPKIYINKEEDSTIGKDFFLNFKVFENNGNYLGYISDVDDSTANVLFIINNETDDDPILIPAVDSFIKNINEEEKIIILDLPEGLI